MDGILCSVLMEVDSDMRCIYEMFPDKDYNGPKNLDQHFIF